MGCCKSKAASVREQADAAEAERRKAEEQAAEAREKAAAKEAEAKRLAEEEARLREEQERAEREREEARAAEEAAAEKEKQLEEERRQREEEERAAAEAREREEAEAAAAAAAAASPSPPTSPRTQGSISTQASHITPPPESADVGSPVPRPQMPLREFKVPGFCAPCQLPLHELEEMEADPSTPERSPLARHGLVAVGERLGCGVRHKRDDPFCEICYNLDLADAPLMP